MSNKSVSFNKSITVSGKTVNVILSSATASDWSKISTAETENNYTYTFSADYNPNLHGRTDKNSLVLNFNTEYNDKILFNEPIKYCFTSTQVKPDKTQVINASNNNLNTAFDGFEGYVWEGGLFKFPVSSTTEGKYTFDIIPSAQTITIDGHNYDELIYVDLINPEDDHIFSAETVGNIIKFKKDSVNFSVNEISDYFSFNTTTNDDLTKPSFQLDNINISISQPPMTYKYKFNGINDYQYFKGYYNVEPVMIKFEDSAITIPSYVKKLELLPADFTSDGDFDYITKDEEENPKIQKESYSYDLTNKELLIDYKFGESVTTPIVDYPVKVIFKGGETYNTCILNQEADSYNYALPQNIQKSNTEFKNLVTFDQDLFHTRIQDIKQCDAKFDGDVYKDVVDSGYTILFTSKKLTDSLKSNWPEGNRLFLVGESSYPEAKTVLENYYLQKTYILLNKDGNFVEYTNEDRLPLSEVKTYISSSGKSDDYDCVIYLYISDDFINESGATKDEVPDAIDIPGEGTFNLRNDDGTFVDGLIVYYTLKSNIDTINFVKAETATFDSFDGNDNFDISSYPIQLKDDTVYESNNLRILKVYNGFNAIDF